MRLHSLHFTSVAFEQFHVNLNWKLIVKLRGIWKKKKGFCFICGFVLYSILHLYKQNYTWSCFGLLKSPLSFLSPHSFRVLLKFNILTYHILKLLKQMLKRKWKLLFLSTECQISCYKLVFNESHINISVFCLASWFSFWYVDAWTGNFYSCELPS